jgi:fermentation-respiration switch protein FrsA (DUF1100 family)
MSVIIAVLSVLLLALLTSCICYLLVFRATRGKEEEEFPMPVGEIYEPYYPSMKKWQQEVARLPQKEVEIKSFDGLTLRGTYYEYSPDAPIELMLHGYRGSAKSDLCGGVLRCFKLGRSCLIVDQRTAGKSGGRVISFGINESRDCLKWIDFIIENINKNAKIIITGISMGAATVMMALSENLPKNVVSALADCGYTSPKEIIIKVLRDLHLPPWLFYPFIKLGARIFGRFDLEETSAVKGVSGANIPIIFIHGEGDDFVPCSMSERLYEICSSEHKKLYTVPGVGHGLAYPAAPEGYYRALREFEEQIQNKAE